VQPTVPLSFEEGNILTKHVIMTRKAARPSVSPSTAGRFTLHGYDVKIGLSTGRTYQDAHCSQIVTHVLGDKERHGVKPELATSEC
jgi:hypothetical protein